MVGDLFDVAQKTLEAGRVDGGMTVIAAPQSLTLAAGSFLADTAKFESVVKQLVPHLRKESPELAEKVRFNAETYAGVTLHTMAIPTRRLGEAGPKLAELVGENLDVVVGIAPDSVYLAAGRSAVSTLKQVIDKGKASADKPAAPMQFSVAGLPIAKTVSAHGRREAAKEVAAKIVKVLEQMPGKDHVTATQLPLPNGQKVHIVIESGILKLLASIPSLQPGQ